MDTSKARIRFRAFLVRSSGFGGDGGVSIYKLQHKRENDVISIYKRRITACRALDSSLPEEPLVSVGYHPQDEVAGGGVDEVVEEDEEEGDVPHAVGEEGGDGPELEAAGREDKGDELEEEERCADEEAQGKLFLVYHGVASQFVNVPDHYSMDRGDLPTWD